MNSSIHFNTGCLLHKRWMTIQKLGVREMQKDVKYLGTYPLKSECNIDTFEPLSSMFNSELAGWRSLFVNQAGRMVLSKSVLSTIPNYSMSNRILLKGVTNQISHTQRAFWWGYGTNTKRLHFIGWGKVLKEKEDGGLGIWNMELVNQSLVTKLVWGFLTNEDAI